MTSTPTSILAFRNGSIGNTLVAVPALRALRRRYPEAKLSVVVDAVGAELLRPCPWIDTLITYDKRGRDRGAAGWLGLVGRLRDRRPSHALLFKRFFRNGLLARLSGARVRAGFSTAGEAPFLNLTLPYDESVSITRLNLRLAALLGASEDDARPEMWLSEHDRAEAERWIVSHRLADVPLVAAHYGGHSTPPTFLPAEAFATLVRQASGPERRVVLLGSGGAEARHAGAIAALVPGAVGATGLPLRVTAALIEKAGLFVGFNSGPAHIAAAVGTPARILFQPGSGAEREMTKWLPASLSAVALLPPAAASPGELVDWCSTVAGSIAPDPVGAERI